MRGTLIIEVEKGGAVSVEMVWIFLVGVAEEVELVSACLFDQV